MSDIKHQHMCFSTTKLLLPWLLALILMYSAVKPGASFVSLSQSPRQLSVSSPLRTADAFSSIDSVSSQCRSANAGVVWSIAPRQRRRRNGRGGGRGMEGAQGLKAAMDFPPFETSDLVETIGKVAVRHHWQSGFIGGSVGVMGTLTAIKLKINQVRELTSCPYCRSTGQLPCATCFGYGSVAIQDTVGASAKVTTTTLTCPCCRGKTYITCINCKGDGRSVPLFLNKKVSRDPESEIEDVGYA